MSSEWGPMTAVIFNGFEDVRDWMTQADTARGKEIIADVHRVEDMIRWPRRAEGLTRTAFADVMERVITGCAVRRRIDKTGQEPPVGGGDVSRWVADFVARDPAVRAWTHNASILVTQAQRKRPGSRILIPILPECGVYCPRRIWDVVMMGKTPSGEIETRAAAEIMAFLRLLNQLSDGEAQYVKTYLHRRLGSGYSGDPLPPELVAQAAAGFRKMEKLATPDELSLLFPRAFLPVK